MLSRHIKIFKNKKGFGTNLSSFCMIFEGSISCIVFCRLTSFCSLIGIFYCFLGYLTMCLLGLFVVRFVVLGIFKFALASLSSLFPALLCESQQALNDLGTMGLLAWENVIL